MPGSVQVDKWLCRVGSCRQRFRRELLAFDSKGLVLAGSMPFASTLPLRPAGRPENKTTGMSSEYPSIRMVVC